MAPSDGGRGVDPSPARAPDRRVRLRRRRAHRAARAAGAPAPRGLRLPGRHGARFPYGERAPAELERFALRDRRGAARRAARSCWSSRATPPTAAALPAPARADDRRRRSASTCSASCGPRPQLAVAATRNGRIGLLATPATVASGAYAAAVAAVDPHVELTSRRLPRPRADHPGRLAVRRRRSSRRCAATARRCARRGVDTVILGCTHYPLVAPMLQRMLGRGVRSSPPARPLARQVEHALACARPRQPARRRGRLPLPVHRRRRGASARSARGSCRCRSARSSTSTSAGGRRSRDRERARARRYGARARDEPAPGRRSSPASCAPRPARR